MTLLVMAAGNGSRYGALKQFDKLGANNEFLFEFSIYDAIKYNFNHIVVITKEQFVDDIYNYLKKRLSNLVKLDVLAQRITDVPLEVKSQFYREKPWGTAHAVWVARKHINKSFVVINADDYYGKGAFKKAADFIKTNAEETQFGLISYHLKDTLSENGSVSRGICAVENDTLKEIKELIKIENIQNKIIDSDTNTILTGSEPTSMNFWICNPLVFDAIERHFKEFLTVKEHIKNGELYIPLVIQKMIDEKIIRVTVLSTFSKWFGITHASDKKQAMNILTQMTNNKDYPSPLWKN